MVAPLQQSHVRSAQPARAHAEGRRKAARAKLQAPRAFFWSLFARTPCSGERYHGRIGVPSGRKAPFGEIEKGGEAGPTTLRRSIEREKLDAERGWGSSTGVLAGESVGAGQRREEGGDWHERGFGARLVAYSHISRSEKTPAGGGVREWISEGEG
jgi:hypothetical protein